MLGGNPVIDQRLIQGGVEILLVTLCYVNQDKLQPSGPLGSFKDFNSFTPKSNFIDFTLTSDDFTPKSDFIDFTRLTPHNFTRQRETP